MSAPASSPFGSRALLGMLLFGALAIIATHYLIGGGALQLLWLLRLLLRTVLG